MAKSHSYRCKSPASFRMWLSRYSLWERHLAAIFEHFELICDTAIRQNTGFLNRVVLGSGDNLLLMIHI